MNIEDLKCLLKDRQIIDFDSSEQDFEHGLRLVLRDMETGEMGLLAVEPAVLTMPDETLLDYSYQVIRDSEHPEHGYDILTRLEPDYEKGETPSLFS